MDKRELDEQMILLQNGEESAFERIYNETKRGLYAFIFSICKNHHMTEDVMQTTYMRIRISVDTYEPGSNALGWMFTIAKNLTLNELNKRKRESLTEFDRENEMGEYDLEDKLTSPLLATMESVLTKTEMQIVLLHVVSGFKHREIADMMKKPLGTVLWAYRNALQKMKKSIAKENQDEN